jgi:hypothetical protein
MFFVCSPIMRVPNMPAPQFLPLIEKHDFAAMRLILNQDFRNKYRSFADWAAQHASWAEESGDGQSVPIMINSIQFALAEGGKDHSSGLAELLEFTTLIGETAAA